MPGGRAEPGDLSKGPNGRNLCRWCSLEIPPGRRRTFCSEFCVHEWKLRSDPGYLREQVLARDRGICAACGLDCVAEWRQLKRLRGPRRLLKWAEWGLKPDQRATLGTPTISCRSQRAAANATCRTSARCVSAATGAPRRNCAPPAHCRIRAAGHACPRIEPMPRRGMIAQSGRSLNSVFCRHLVVSAFDNR